MPNFMESPRFPEDISCWAVGGPNFNTGVAELFSGRENRVVNWDQARCRFDLSEALRSSNPNSLYALKTVIKYFRGMKGKAYGFRWKDRDDNAATQDGTVAGSEGLMGTTGLGAGVPQYQMYKQYFVATGFADLRKIRKPVASGFLAYRNGVSVGAATLDTANGLVTYPDTANANASNIAVGVSTLVTLSANLSLANGKLLYLTGFTGANAATVNNRAHTINAITGAGPFVFNLSTNTSNMTITLGSGKGWNYPQTTDILTWAGSFDVPVRLDIDAMRVGQDKGGFLAWEQLATIELLED